MSLLVLLAWACTSTAPSPPANDLVDAARRATLEERLDRELSEGWEPRTRHLDPAGRPRFTNALIETGSPYLRQHAHNPVSWFPWGPEALELARRTGRPIFLSIGYATCHWCHVMEEESFEDEEIAAFLNEHFVPVKVDRETRPDLDALYMDAVVALHGSGGWPATLVLDPEGRPFFAATYVPPRDGVRGRRKGLLTLLGEIATVWETDRARLDQVARSLTEHLRADANGPDATGLPGADLLERTVRATAEHYDDANGGLKARQKFWSSTPLRALLVAASRGDDEARRMATHTLDRLMAGGVYDHVAGGFHRYAVDPAWKVPHFEKMLYDQARLARVYAEAFQLTGERRYGRVVHETLEAMIRDLGVDGGGFASALDADSLTPGGEREEGRFATWTSSELDEVLQDRATAFRETYTRDATIDGRWVLGRETPLDTDTRRSFRKDRMALLLARRQRPAPLRDDKILTGWNGLAIAALAQAGWLLQQRAWIDEAVVTADRVLDARVDGRLVRVVGPDEPDGTAFLDDHAYLLDGLLTLFEATGDRRWLDEALALEQQTRAHFATPSGPWRFRPDDGEVLLAEHLPVRDGPLPSANSVLLGALYRLAAVTGDDGHRVRADAIAGGLPFGQPLNVAEAVVALEARHRPLHEIVLVTGPGERHSGLHAAIRTVPPARRVLVHQLAGEPPVVPLAAEKVRLDAPTVYVCHGGVCERPTTDPAELASLLAEGPADR